MNPLHLRGPMFLLVYLGFSILVIACVVRVRNRLEADAVPKLPFVDPYLIACLRKGPAEAIRVALLSLLDRRLIAQNGETLSAAPGAYDSVRRPLEKQMISRLVQPTAAYELIHDADMRAACAPLDDELVRLGLCVSPQQKLVRAALGGLALVALWLVAGAKLQIALAAGRRNVGFLIALAVVCSLIVVVVLVKRRTSVGDALLADMRTLFDGLKARAKFIEHGGGNAELALLMGVFGASALEGPSRTLVEKLFPKAVKEPNGRTNSGCGSSCSSSSGSSSSCGGGGCGGGGCGGCGS